MEKLIKKIIVITSCLLFAACASNNVWQTTSNLTPKSYKTYSGGTEHHVGILRRLLILPVQFKTLIGGKPYFENKPLWTPPELGYSSDEHASQRYFDIAVKHLSNWKGYEVVNLESSLNDTDHPLITSQQIKNYTSDLHSWAYKTGNYENPSENIIEVISKLGNISNADGVLIISGVNKLNSDLKTSAIILSASLLWPILFYDYGFFFKATIFEVNTGKVIWKSTGASNITALFKKLENAIPKAMTR
jgi:hypothetical protein